MSRIMLIGYYLTADLEETSSIYFPDDEFKSDNQTIADAAWLDIEIVLGFIALGQETIKMHKLPHGDEFVWDRSKSVYMINMYHSLHCLVFIP